MVRNEEEAEAEPKEAARFREGETCTVRASFLPHKTDGSRRWFRWQSLILLHKAHSAERIQKSVSKSGSCSESLAAISLVYIYLLY